MTRVLAIAGFDPASVLLGHRNALRASTNIDYRLAVQRAYTPRQFSADFIVEDTIGFTQERKPRNFSFFAGSFDELAAFARSADIVQIHPGIGHGGVREAGRDAWPLRPDGFAPADGLDMPNSLCCNGVLRLANPNARRIAYFHGSIHTWANRARYAEHYRALGYEIATSTVDYAVEMGARYLPPAFRRPEDIAPARLREAQEPLTVAYCPTDPENCHAAAIFAICRELAVPLRFVCGRPWKVALAVKRESNAGFDHLRGAFSVNTVENCALGLQAFVGLTLPYREKLEADGFHCPPFGIPCDYGPAKAIEGLREAIAESSKDCRITTSMQKACRGWYEDYMTPDAIAARLSAFYRGP